MAQSEIYGLYILLGSWGMPPGKFGRLGAMKLSIVRLGSHLTITTQFAIFFIRCVISYRTFYFWLWMEIHGVLSLHEIQVQYLRDSHIALVGNP